MNDLLRRVLRFFGLGEPSPPGSPGDPYAWKPVPKKPTPKGRSGAVAVAEPED